jgi:hypothetical protein
MQHLLSWRKVLLAQGRETERCKNWLDRLVGTVCIELVVSLRLSAPDQQV